VKISKRAVAVLSALGLAAATVTALPATGAAAKTAGGTAQPGFRHACPAAARGWGRCGALVDTNVVTFQGMATDASVAGYGPAQLQSAYNLTLAAAAAGKGETVALVDAYNDPDAAANLKTYRAHYGLPACGAGCFSKVNEEGKASPLPKSAGKTGWGTEESLDLDMVSAICPHCTSCWWRPRTAPSPTSASRWTPRSRWAPSSCPTATAHPRPPARPPTTRTSTTPASR